jgi:hypothetical protein
MFRFSEKSGVHGFSGLHGTSGVYGNSGLYKVSGFNPLDLDPYLLFDAETSMLGTLEAFTLDLDPANPSTLDVITATRAGTATFTDANGVIQSASPNTVRVDHVDGVPMILVEPSATNLVPNSSSFENVNGSVQTTGFEAPDGSNDAVKISNINGATDPMVAWSSLATLSPSTQYSGSIFVKGSAGESIRFYLRRAFGGAMANSPFLNVVLTGSWQSVEIGSMTTASDNNNGRVFIFQASSGTPADEVYLWGAQLEAGSVSTSVIPTSGGDAAARTRNADDLVISGSAFTDFFNATEGTTYVETAPKTTTNIPHIFEYHNSSDANANRMGIYLPSVSLNAFVRSSGVTTASLTVGNINLNQLNRVAISYKVNDISGSINGGSYDNPDTSAALPSGLDKLHIGNVYNFNFPLNGHIKRLIYWPYHSDSL